MRDLVDAGADVKAVENLGETRLAHAVTRPNAIPEIVRILIEAGADVNVETEFHGSALYAAISLLDGIEPNDQIAIVEMLNNAGADVNQHRRSAIAVITLTAPTCHWIRFS